MLAIINKTTIPAVLTLSGAPAGEHHWSAMQLSGKALDASTDVAFKAADPRFYHTGRLMVPASTALFLSRGTDS
jgi:hypothetical protein